MLSRAKKCPQMNSVSVSVYGVGYQDIYQSQDQDQDKDKDTKILLMRPANTSIVL